ncbi:glycosyltransferase [Microbacter sp. GSS18]|nr:glycosyltransferase [Microbacter sp. GSS18]
MTGSAADGRRMRVLHLDHTSAAGGAEYALKRMLVTGPPWQPLLLVPPSGRGGVYADLPGRAPVRVAGVAQRAGVSAGGALPALAALGRLLAQAVVTRLHPGFRTADIVDANTARAAAYGSLAALTSRRPLVVHLRDMVEPEALGGFGFALMSRVALRRADGVIANSRATLESARPFLRPDAVTAVIPSASGLIRASEPRRADARPVTVGMLARVDPWKGQLLLLEAFADACAGTGARLEIAGGAPFGHEGHLDSLRSRAVELGVAEQVAFLGHVEDTAAALARWDVAVQASLRPEPLGQNVLQYLAAGCATVVADEGGPTEWVVDGDNGLRFTPRDRVSLAGALRRLAEDADLRARLGASAVRTPGLLSDAEVARAHADLYAAVLSGPA